MIFNVNRIIAALLIIVTFPAIILMGLIIKMKYPGNIFYEHTREGKNGKPFKIIKLRTMVSNSNEILENLLNNDAELAKMWNEFGWIANDPRIAGNLGKLSRQLSLDELPQLINILKGEMAFIGPRPLEIPSVQALNPKTRKFRYSVLPGITGLAQVLNRSATIRQMQLYDRIYIRNKSVCLNTYIFFKTIGSIVNRTGI